MKALLLRGNPVYCNELVFSCSFHETCARVIFKTKKAEGNRNVFPVPLGRIRGAPKTAVYDLIVFEAASQVTGFCRKYDSFAM